MFTLPEHLIGGGYVRRKFNGLSAGHHLNRDEIMAMPINNRRAAISLGMIDVYPQAPGGPGERFVVNRGFGKFDVIEGRKLNAEPVTKEAAEELAGLVPGDPDEA